MRILHRFKGLYTQFFGLVDNIMISTTPLKAPTKAIEYLNKYTYVLNNVQKIKTSDKYQNKIWQLWFQGEDKMPPIVKACTDSVKYYHKDDVIMLTYDNLTDYIELPDYIIEKHKKGIIPHANLSDMVRATLLSKYGGCWVDSTIYLTGRIPDDILNADFFAFRSYNCDTYRRIESYDEFKMYSNYFREPMSVESPYFIESKAGGDIMNCILALFLEYWKYENHVVDYLMIDKFFNMVLINKKELRKQFLEMPTYYIPDVLLLADALFEHFDPKTFDNIKKATNIHKLTHKNLKRSPFKDSFLEYLINTPVDKV